MDDQELLRTVPIFSELTDADIASLARLSSRRRYPKDTVVFFENEEGDFFFMILEGRIKVTILGDDGREVILSMLGPGDFFGEMALVTNRRRTATVTATESTEAMEIEAFYFKPFLIKNPSVAVAILEGVVNRLREVQERLDAWMGS